MRMSLSVRHHADFIVNSISVIVIAQVLCDESRFIYPTCERAEILVPLGFLSDLSRKWNIAMNLDISSGAILPMLETLQNNQQITDSTISTAEKGSDNLVSRVIFAKRFAQIMVNYRKVFCKNFIMWQIL